MTQIGIQAEILSDRQQSGFGPLSGRPVRSPLGTSDGTQQHSVAGAALLRSPFWIRDAVFVCGAAAQVHVCVRKCVAEPLAHGINDPHSFVHNFRADAVAADQRNFIIHKTASFRIVFCCGLYFARPRFFNEFIRPPASMMPLTKSGNGTL